MGGEYAYMSPFGCKIKRSRAGNLVTSGAISWEISRTKWGDSSILAVRVAPNGVTFAQSII